MEPTAADARLLLAVIDRGHRLVAVSVYDCGRLLYLTPAGMALMGLADGAAVGARRAPGVLHRCGGGAGPGDGIGHARAGPMGGEDGVSAFSDR